MCKCFILIGLIVCFRVKEEQEGGGGRKGKEGEKEGKEEEEEGEDLVEGEVDFLVGICRVDGSFFRGWVID